MCKAAGAQEILAFSDSQLIVSQVNGDYEARDPNMIKYMQAVHKEIEHLKSFEAKQIPRTENNQADALSKLASSASYYTPRHVFWEVKDKRSIEQELCTPMVAILDRSSTWMDPIIAYKVDGTLPDDSSLAAKIQKKSSWFEWWNGVLYKKSFSRPLLRCVTPEKGKEILDDFHQGLCSSHIGGRALAEKALRTGYYWPTLREDALALAGPPSHSYYESHSVCQVGPYTAAPGGRRYVIVVVDYFTKWVEAEALKNIKTSDVRAFIWKNIMTRFGIPQAIVFDKGPQFETPKLKEWLADHGIHSCFASVGRPQANGQVEAFNKIISEGIKKKLDEAKGLWADEPPNVLWSIRTTAKNSTGETPFLLAFGAEVVLPIEMCEPTLRVMLYDENANWEMMKLALDFLPEVRGKAALRQQLYKIRMAREYNKKFSKRVLKVGDFVLQKMESVGRANEQGKLTPTWEGPYEIYDEVRDGTYRIQDMQGRPILRTWNADNLKKYFF
ncbi:uncharacterized protein [Spinacia oleracea]|uniref:Integrase catalytic domain-containing protein n=1 Tax=Spinacia oleracea TaxID=3562 RepID=A0ABM3R7U0_SPIOL|nr:uncharacterized protein LOC130467246 [Spinacia oleracea]